MKLTRLQAVQICMISFQIIFERIVKRGFFANLTDCSSAPIDINSNSWGVVLFHPSEKVRVSGESLTAGKDFCQALAGALDQLAQKRIRIAIDIAQECQIQRITTRR